ncbi:helicase-related protein [Magnetospira thiophila]
MLHFLKPVAKCGPMQIDTSQHRLTALLGPTNTGKTHHAMERMLGHAGGMIGFPLRLLARENYERAVALKGAAQVALITGEEKIVPPHPRYFLCTVEAMPLDRVVPFLAIDEIQMCADPDRGHIFTDRLLYARGTQETMFMGADTIAPLLRRLVPHVEISSRPRFSTLRYAGPCKLTKMPRRSAIVAFSAAEVYAIAELVRRQRGGAAVVLGALSPRTRNAQVGLYQAGEVEHLVATDAIGMGLNMDVDHVAFAQVRKFDGRMPRHLTPPEMAQIAGRAGRHMTDGSFGVTDEVRDLEPELVERLENHRFDPMRAIFWRNSDLRTTSVEALRRSLALRPDEPGLMRARLADDELALTALTRDEDILRRAAHPEGVRLLWEVCQIPDFQKIMTESHTRLLSTIFGHLSGPDHRLPTDWVAEQVRRIDRTDGGIDHLVQRIAHVRTWTYVSHRGDWLVDSAHWQGLTRQVEDRLSDALHERLTQKFVDRRTSVLSRRLKDQDILDVAVAGDGRVLVEGHFVGKLDGFRFQPDSAAGALAQRTLSGAALKALKGEIVRRMERLEKDEDAFIALQPDGVIVWRTMPVARLARGDDPLRPRLEPLPSALLEASQRDRLRGRLETWLAAHIAAKLDPLTKLAVVELPPAARGVAFQVVEHFGSLPRRLASDQISALERDDRRALREMGLRIGREAVYAPALLKPAAVNLRALLWNLAQGTDHQPPPDGRMSVPLTDGVPHAFYEAIGYRPLGPLAVRIDMVERIAGKAWDLAQEGTKGEFAITPELLSLAGCSVEVMAQILKALNYRAREVQPEPPAPASDTAVETESAPETQPETPVEPPAPILLFRYQRPRPPAPPKQHADTGTREPRDRPDRKPRPAKKGPPRADHKDRKPKNEARPPRPPKPERQPDPDSPFAVLKDLIK